MHKPRLITLSARILRLYHDAPSPRRASTNLHRDISIQRAQVPNSLTTIMKHLLLPIITLASAVTGTSSDELPPWMYVSTVTSDVYITAICTGRPLPMDCEINSWTDTVVSWTLTKGRAYTRFLCSVQLNATQRLSQLQAFSL